MWNGARWSDVGGGVAGTGNFSVSALAPMGSSLYVAGSFTNAGGLVVNRIAKWGGANWSALGSGITATPFVNSSTVFKGETNGAGIGHKAAS